MKETASVISDDQDGDHLTHVQLENDC